MGRKFHRSNFSTSLRLVSFLVISVIICGCTVGPDYVKPDMAAPDAWHTELTKGIDSGQADFQDWWKVFNDPALDNLIQRAADNN